MLGFKEALDILEKSKEFKDWRKNNPSAYVSYGFMVIEEKDDNWKIGYYHEDKDKITSFNVGDNITIEPAEEVFKKQETKVEAIDLGDMKLDLADAVAVANKLQKEEFATENPQKVIAVLQKLKNNLVWNITFITQSMNTLNFKIKSGSGRVLEKKLTNLMDFRKE